MKLRSRPVLTMLLLAWSTGCVSAQELPPIPLSRFPHLAIISPTFTWDSRSDLVRTISATCPGGRAIGGGIAIEKGNGSLRISESYPDGASWVIRAANRGIAGNGQPVQVRAFAMCLLPVARGGSVQIAQYPRLLHVSHRFALAPGNVTTAERQACAQNTLIVSGGFGLDPQFKGRSLTRMELSYPDKWGWNVRASNGADTAQPPADVRIFALCLGSDEGLSIQDYQSIEFASAAVTVKPGDGAVRQAIACRNGQARVITGGARLMRGKNASIEMQESFPDTPASWTVAMINRTAAKSGDATVRLYAICLAP